MGMPTTILVYFEDLDTLLIKSKMCIVLRNDLSFHAHPRLNRAHIMVVYFVSQIITAPPSAAGARGHMPMPTILRH